MSTLKLKIKVRISFALKVLDNLMDWLVRLEASNNQEDNWADKRADNQADEWVWAN